MILRLRWSIILLIVVLLLGSFLLRPAQLNWLMPFPVRVTVTEINTAPDRYVNRLVEIHGVFQYVHTTTCGIPGPDTVGLADDSLSRDVGSDTQLASPTTSSTISSRHPTVVVSDIQPPPPTMIFMNIGEQTVAMISSMDMSLDSGQPVIVWGRLLRQTTTSYSSCGPGASASASSPITFSLLEIKRIQFSDGRVLP